MRRFPLRASGVGLHRDDGNLRPHYLSLTSHRELSDASAPITEIPNDESDVRHFVDERHLENDERKP